MLKRIVSGIMLTLLLTGMLTLAFNIQPVKAGTITVPNDYPTIQEAINHANEGDTIFVRNGTYYENIVISKSLILMGQGNNLTIIDSCGKGDVIYLKANNTRVKGFTVRNGVNGIRMAPWTSGHVIEDNIVLYNDQGISGHYDCKNITVYNNTITLNNVCGVEMLFSNSTISNNLICNNGNADNWLWSSGIEITMGVGPADIYCINNTIVGNTIRDNNYGIYAIRYSVKNTFIHNNFINNTKQIYGSMNMHNDTFLENYWSDYTGFDLYGGSYQNETGSDGIGDTPYIIDENNIDHYPLMNPYSTPPPPAYALTIITTAGGTTDPNPGTYSYTANSSVQVIAIPDTNYLFDHWKLDSINVGSASPYTVLMDKNHTLKAVFSPVLQPLSASISPLSASINVGQSVTFTSIVSGGTPSYSYQWYLNGNPVSGATSSSWTLSPATSGIYYVYLKVTDTKDNTIQSETARITVVAVPVGGYSFQTGGYTTVKLLTAYLTLVAILAISFTAIRRKTPVKTK